MEEYRVDIRDNNDMLDVVESMIGYTPEDLIVAVTYDEASRSTYLTCQQVHTNEGVRLAVDALLGEKDPIVVISWGDGSNDLANAALSSYTTELPVAKLPVIICATAKEWWWWPNGPHVTRTTSQAKVELTWAGIDMVVAESREAMIVSKIMPEPRWGDIQPSHPPVPVAEGGDWVAEQLMRTERLDQLSTGMVIGALELPAVTDHLVEMLCQLRVATMISDLYTMRARLAEVAAEACDELKGRVYRPLGLASYLVGEPEVALAAAVMAERFDPDHPGNTHLAALFSNSIAPGTLAETILVGLDTLKKEEGK